MPSSASERSGRDGCAPWGLRCPGQVPGWGPLTCVPAEPRDPTCLQLPAKQLIGLAAPGGRRRLACWVLLRGRSGLSPLVPAGSEGGTPEARAPLSTEQTVSSDAGSVALDVIPVPHPLAEADSHAGPGLLLTHFAGSQDAVQLLSLPFLGAVRRPGGRGPGLLLLLVSGACGIWAVPAPRCCANPSIPCVPRAPDVPAWDGDLAVGSDLVSRAWPG